MIKELIERRKALFTDEEIAHKLGVNLQTIQMMEAGQPCNGDTALGYLYELVVLRCEESHLRQQLQFATSELTAAKLVVEAASDGSWMRKQWAKGKISFREVHRAEVKFDKALSTYGSQFPGSEEKKIDWSSERETAIYHLRQVCEAIGDNDWTDDLHLGDAIDKHLGKHVLSTGGVADRLAESEEK